jgi:hypothetical protein
MKMTFFKIDKKHYITWTAYKFNSCPCGCNTVLGYGINFGTFGFYIGLTEYTQEHWDKAVAAMYKERIK